MRGVGQGEAWRGKHIRQGESLTEEAVEPGSEQAVFEGLVEL